MTGNVQVATRKGLFTLTCREHRWQISAAEFLGENCAQVLFDARDGTRYVALDHGHFGNKLHRARQDEPWQEIAVPSYPVIGAHEPPWIDAFGREIPHSLQLIWALEAGPRERAGELWCGTVPGGLFRSQDAGDSWQLVESLWNQPLRQRWFGGGMDYPGIHSVCLHPTDSQRIDIAVSCGGVWSTADAGVTWQNIGEGFRSDYVPPQQANDPATQDIHRIARCRQHPEVLWAQHHNGIFRSTDGGAHWQEITGVEPSVFGFAVAAHPTDPNTAWFVPAVKDEHRAPKGGQVVVTRTNDGGNSFQILRDGLPQVHAYDLVYRHCLDVDESGQCLAMGSTTGSLWLSDDSGDHWQTISTHLPPIYAVRFTCA